MSVESPVETLKLVRDHFDYTGQTKRMANMDEILGERRLPACCYSTSGKDCQCPNRRKDWPRWAAPLLIGTALVSLGMWAWWLFGSGCVPS